MQLTVDVASFNNPTINILATAMCTSVSNISCGLPYSHEQSIVEFEIKHISQKQFHAISQFEPSCFVAIELWHLNLLSYVSTSDQDNSLKVISHMWCEYRNYIKSTKQWSKQKRVVFFFSQNTTGKSSHEYFFKKYMQNCSYWISQFLKKIMFELVVRLYFA